MPWIPAFAGMTDVAFEISRNLGNDRGAFHMHTIYSDNRKSGISLIGDLPWGSHFCQFYQTGNDLVDILMPYFKAGLENNEFCLWVTSRPLGVEDAKKALKKALPQFDKYASEGRIEIVPYSRWHARRKKPGEAIVSMLDRAISNGFDGLRFACNAFPEKKGSKTYACYGADVVGRYNVLAAFAYPRDRFDAAGLMEVVKNHRFALVHNTGRWEVIETSEVRIVKDALKRSEEKLQSLFSNMSEGFAYHRIVLDAGGKPCDYVFLEVNESFERLTGLKADKLIGKRVTEALAGVEKDPADWIGRYGKVALTGEPVHFESHAKALGKWFSISAFSPHKGYFAVTFNDITERKRTEEELRRNQEWLRVTLSSIGDAVIATDDVGKVTFLNPIGVKLTGWTAEEALGQPIQSVFRIINERTRQPAENIVERVLREGCIVSLANHTSLLTLDGREIPIEDSAAPITDSAGNLMGVVLVFHDVTEKRRAEEELRTAHDGLEARVRERTTELERINNELLMEIGERKRAEETARAERQLFYDVLETLPAYVCLLAPDYHVPFANRVFRDRFGESTGLRCFEHLFGRSEPCEVCDTYKVLKTMKPHEWEWTGPDNCNYQVFDFPFSDTDGSILILEMGIDVTERKQAEKALRELNEVLEQRIAERTEELSRAHGELEVRVRERTAELRTTVARLEVINQELQEFAHVASHDLQEPLRKIQTFCDIARTKCAPALDEAGKGYLERVFNSACRMRQLLDDLLQFSKVAAKPEPPKELDLVKIAREAADLFEGKVRETGGLIEIESIPGIEADETHMLRLFQNLIGNALKFRGDESPRIKIHGRLDGQGGCEIFVKDNGIGFERRFKERIFKPFQRLHNRDEYEGTGMGLAICRKIAERHGGSIRAESELGKGSTFIVKLPVKQGRLEGI